MMMLMRCTGVFSTHIINYYLELTCQYVNKKFSEDNILLVTGDIYNMGQKSKINKFHGNSIEKLKNGMEP